MPVYEYRGVNLAGKSTKGMLEAENPKNARLKLKRDGITITEIKEKNLISGGKKGGKGYQGKINPQEFSLVIRQLATLVKARVQIVEAFSALVEQTDNAKLKTILWDVRTKINEGSTLNKALSAYPKVFDNIFVNMVDAGEKSGQLDTVLVRLADFSEEQMALRNKVSSAMLYPVIMGVIGISLLTVIMTFAVPKIVKIFETSNMELPLVTKIVIFISDFMTNPVYSLPTGIGLVLGSILFRKYVSAGNGQAWWHRLTLKVPIVGPLVRMVNVERFTSTLSTLLSSGVALLPALYVVRNLVTNVHIQATVDEAAEAVKEGQPLAEELRKGGYFPTIVTHMIAIGEKSGELTEMLDVISRSYRSQVSNRLEGITNLLEPVMLVVLGGIVGIIVFAVFIPMLQMNNVG